MKTLISHSISEAAQLLRANEVVGIPTETVYGLAGNALRTDVVAKIFAAKKRPHFDPLIVHLKNESAAKPAFFAWTDYLTEKKYIAPLPPSAKKSIDQLLNQFWPGPLTILLRKNAVGKEATIPDLVTAGLPKVGLRVPSHPLTQTLLQSLEFPLAAPSANRFGKISPTTADHVADELKNHIPMVLDGGPCSVGVESTVIEFLEPQDLLETSPPRFMIHRPGGVSLQSLTRCLPEAKFEFAQPQQLAVLQSPGTSLSHYAPRTPLRLMDYPVTVEKILTEIRPLQSQREISWALLTYAPLLPGFLTELKATPISYPIETRSLLTQPDAPDSQAAQALFRSLREMDTDRLDLIIAESPPHPQEGLQHAIFDRLKRASYREQ